MKKHAFDRFRLLAKLSVLNDKLIKLINKRLAISQWKEFAFEDKRIVKMMARAVKHRNRVLKKKVFLLIKRLAYP
jgi:hypothetical protein